mgnify:CR=1 FL=1
MIKYLILYFPMLIFSGATLPFEVMPEFVQRFVGVFPMIQGIQLMKATFLVLPLEHAGLPIVIMLDVTLVCGDCGQMFQVGVDCEIVKDAAKSADKI